MTTKWTSAAICDPCWSRLHGDRAPHRMVEEHRRAETCYVCDQPTRSGIYVRAEVPDA